MIGQGFFLTRRTSSFAADSQRGRKNLGWQALREGRPQERRRARPDPQERDGWSEVDRKVREGLHEISLF